MTPLAYMSCLVAVPHEHPACESRISLQGKRPFQKRRKPQRQGRANPSHPMQLQAFPGCSWHSRRLLC
jgi:hypothetical protein